jgi:hypothetical protein
MSFGSRESSRQKGEPVSLFHFQWGLHVSNYYAYTDHEEPITFGGKTYQPIPITMGAVKSSGTLDKQTIEVRTPQNVDLARRFVYAPPSQVITLIVRQGHIGDPANEFLVSWTGRVLGHKRARNEAIYTMESYATSMRRTMLRRHYMLGCGHVLYGPMCRADREAATSVRNVLSVSGPTVTLDASWAPEDRKPKYVNGVAEWTSADGSVESRSILKLKGSSNEQLLLDGPAVGLTGGMSMKVIYGCNHLAGLTDDCIALHNNIFNYGGEKDIPLKNPLALRNTYY